MSTMGSDKAEIMSLSDGESSVMKLAANFELLKVFLSIPESRESTGCWWLKSAFFTNM